MCEAKIFTSVHPALNPVPEMILNRVKNSFGKVKRILYFCSPFLNGNREVFTLHRSPFTKSGEVGEWLKPTVC
jgi:hypothetical protein